MEPQIYLGNSRRECRPCCCIDLISAVLIILIAFAVGLLIGALTGILALLGLGAIIVFLVILIIMLIVRIIMLVCKEIRRC